MKSLRAAKPVLRPTTLTFEALVQIVLPCLLLHLYSVCCIETQACQGTVHQEGIETDEAPGLGTGIQKTLPKEADFLLSCATVPGYVSYRSTKSGSWFVNALVDNIEKYHDELDLVRILIQVNYQLGNGVAKVKQGDMKQIAAPSFTLRKDLYLHSLPT